SKKEDSETKVGNVMNLEGGLGGDFLKGGLIAGLDYYASFKLTDDQIEGFPDILILGKNKVFAVRPEVQLALAKDRRAPDRLGRADRRVVWDLCRRADDHPGLARDQCVHQ